MPTNDFNGRPFYVGTFNGVRSFKVDRLGRLTGVHMTEVFRPGENVARCNGGQFAAKFAALMAQVDPMGRTRAGHAAAPVTTGTGQHHVGGLDCTCGYYAYFDGGNDYHVSGQVTGIIEGYGTVTVGDRGFRAERARLVALVDPARMSGWRQRWDDFSGWADRHEGLAIASILVFAASLVSGLAAGTGASPWFFALLLPAVVALACFVAGAHGMSVNIDSRHESPAAPFDLIRRNYPDVPVYRSLRAATAAHPIYQPEPVTPETAEDFWERDA